MSKSKLSHVKAAKAIVNPMDGTDIKLTKEQGGRARAFTRREWDRYIKDLERNPKRRGAPNTNYWIYVEDIPAPEPGDKLSIEKTGGSELACMKKEQTNAK